MLYQLGHDTHSISIHPPVFIIFIQFSFSGNIQMIKVLLKHQADITAAGSMIEKSEVNVLGTRMLDSRLLQNGGYGTNDDIFPLYVAAKYGHFQIVKELLDAGASVDQTNAIGQSPLHITVICTSHHSRNIVTQLTNSGANVNLQDNNCKTPLHYACGNRDVKIVTSLLKKDTDHTIRDNHGLSVLEIAAEHSYPMMQLLIKNRDWSPKEIIEAYEITAPCDRRLTSECMSKATSMRIEHGLPKVVKTPQIHYRNIKEWENKEELDLLPGKYTYQCLLARERIFEGRHLKLEPIHFKLLGKSGEFDRNKNQKCNTCIKFETHRPIFLENFGIGRLLV
jgi:hypothetical protein